MVTNAAPGPDGRLYVADGYGNAWVHVFDGDGALLFSWGEPGTGPGQFRLPHGIAIDRRGTVYVADRENSRIQLFDAAGTYLREWTHVLRPDDVSVRSACPPAVGPGSSRWTATPCRSSSHDRLRHSCEHLAR